MVANNSLKSRPAMPPVLLGAAFASGAAVAGLIVFFFVRIFVVCFGSSCLQENLVPENAMNAAYLFKGRHCFVVAETLLSRQITDVNHPGLADTALSTVYWVYPNLRLFIIPSQTTGGPIISISAGLLEPKRDFDFCSDDVRMQNAGNKLVFVGLPRVKSGS